MLWKWQGGEKYKPSKLLVCQVKKVAMGIKGYPGLKELDLGGGSFGHVGHSPIGAVSPQLFRNAFPNLVNSSRGRRGASDSVRREPGVGGANLRRRLWILSQAEGLAVGD